MTSRFFGRCRAATRTTGKQEFVDSLLGAMLLVIELGGGGGAVSAMLVASVVS